MSDYWEDKIKELGASKESVTAQAKSYASSSSSSGSDYWQQQMDELSASTKNASSNLRSAARKKKYDDDIAPISAKVRAEKKKKEEEEKKKKRKWFEKGLFEDGYDFGDVSRTILGTTTDVLENVGSGIIGMGEKAVDALAYIAPYAANSQFYSNGGFNLETEKAHREAVEQSKKDLGEFIAKDLYDEEAVARAIISDPARKIGIDSEKQSVFGEKSDALIQSGGQLLATAGLAAAGLPWWATTGVTSFGGEAENAMNQGATYEQAGASAAISAGAEILSEKLSGGISFGGKTLDDALTKQLARGISNKMGRTFAKLGMDMAGEGAEEVFSQIASNLGSSLYKEEDLKELLFSEEAFDEYVESFIGGAVLGGASGSYNAVKSSKQGVDYASGMTQNEQKVVDKLYKDEVASREKNGKVTQKEKSQIYDSILEKMEKGDISVDTIVEAIGGEKYEQYKQVAEWEDSLQKEYDTLNKEYEDLGTKETPNLKDQSRYSELKEMLPGLKTRLDNVKATSTLGQMKAQLTKDVYEMSKSDRLVESFFENVRSKQKFEADLSKYEGRAKDVIKQVMDSGLADNSNQSHEFWDMVAKVAVDRDTNVSLVDNDQMMELVKKDIEASGKTFDASKFEGKIIDGIITEDGIAINAKTNRALNFVVGHEITHTLEKAKSYGSLQKILFKYAQSEYKARYEQRAGQYEDIYSSDDYKAKIDREVTADLVGDIVFTDKEFVKHLSTENRTVFQQVWDEIKHLSKLATAGSKQARELERVKKEFAKVWREASVGKDGVESRYSLEKTGKSKYNKRSRYSETETLFMSWENGSAPVGEVKKFNRFGKSRYYEKTENGCVELSWTQYNERNGRNAEETYGRIQRQVNGITDPNGTSKGNLSGSMDSDRDAGRTSAVSGQTFGEELRNDIAGSVSSDGGYTRRNGLTQTGYNNEASDESGASSITFSNDYAAIRNFMKEGDTGTEHSDTRFSLSETVEETKDLVALHNLTADKLTKSLELGGLPMPSLAVTKADIPHSNFGEISLVFGRETIDPKANKKNKVYSADAWTPVFPRVEYEADSKVANRVSQKLRELDGKVDDYFHRDLNRVSFGFEDYLNSEGGEEGLIQRVMDNYGMKAAYLEDIGKHIEKVTKLEEAKKDYNPDAADKYMKILDILGVSTAEEVGKYNLKEARDNHGEELEAVYPGVTKSSMRMSRIFSAVMSYLENKDSGPVYNTVTDSHATQKAVDDALNAEGYEAWVRNLFSGIVKDSGIYNNKGYYTPSGNRRSFKQTHLPFTLENIVKAMASQNNGNAKNVSGFNGIKTLRAATAETFKSVADMHQRKGRLQNRTQAEADALNDALQSRLFELIEAIDNESGQMGGSNSFIRFDTIGEIITEIGEGGKYSVADIQRIFKQYSRNVSDDTALAVKQLLYDVTQMPVNIFEAKPQRVVSFDEAKVFVIPNNVDAKLKQELLNRGFNIAEYDPNVEGDRQRVVNQFEDLKFSMSDVDQEHKRYGNWNVYAKDILLDKSEIAPTAEESSDIAPTVSETESVHEDAPIYESNDKSAPEGQTAMFEPVGETPTRTTRKEYHQSIIENIKARFTEKGFDFDKVLEKAKNLSTWSTVDNTPQRVMEKSLGYKEGGILADITVNKVAQNESEGIKWLNSYVAQLKKISKEYGIKPGSKESAAAQMYAEGFYVNDKNEIVRYGDPELIQDFGNGDVRRRIQGLARDARIRKIYDDTLAAINESRSRNLYDEIPRLDNYFLHFRAMEDTFSTLGLPFNPNDIRAKDLPTDLNGVTADLKPGQPYFASAMHRKGKRTSFDLLGGVERYLNSAKNQIYHIDDIQTLRALRNYIAETYGQASGLEDIDLMSDAEAEERIKQVYGSHLSTFAKFLNEEANVLAGKTALIDRGVEGIIGRRGITFLNTLNRQVGSNMVGYNVSSSLTNFLPVAQTFAKTNKFDFTKAFAQTVANKLSGGKFDSFAEDSPVVIRRKGEDRFYRTPWQKMADPGYALMGLVDDISTEIIARTKYNEFTRKGMDSQKAHFETDKWVSKLMGDRSLGQQPQLYNSKMLGLVTKFQLEVRNQLDSQFYDTIQETKVSNEHIQNGLARNAKTAAKVASVFAQLAVAQHLYGMAFESIAGYNPAFDIIEVLMTALGYDDEEDSEDTALDNLTQGFQALLEDLPYASTFTGGGRIPVSSAIPDVGAILNGEDEYGNEIGVPKAIKENLQDIAPYYLMPGGYGQLKKTTQGLKMFSDDHPIAGSYTEAGNLRFNVEDTVGSRIKAGIFGQYASENAQKYFDQEQRTLNPEQTAIFAGLDIPIEEYWEYRDNLYEFYDVKDQLKEAANADGATEEDILKNKYINSVNSEISKLYDQQKEIAESDSSDKQEKLREIQSEMERLISDSKYGLYDVTISGAYGEVGDRRFNYDADKNAWYEIKPKQSNGDDNWYYIQEQLSHDKLGMSYEDFWNGKEPSKGATYYGEYNGKRYNYDADNKQWYEIRAKNDDGSDNWYYQKEQEVTKGLGISYEEYWSKPKEYNFAYDKPGKYAIAQAIGGYDSYIEHYEALENWQSDNYISADKDANGNSISGSRKEKVIDYINGLDLDYGEKIILYRTQYSSKSDKRAYNDEIIDYLNSRDDISYMEMKSILEELGMKIDSRGNITW